MKTKHIGWINIFKPYYTQDYQTSVKVYDTYEEAREQGVEDIDYADTIRIDFYDNE